MAKSRPGLPSDFSLDIAPANPGDYLDEDSQTHTALLLKKKNDPLKTPSKVESQITEPKRTPVENQREEIAAPEVHAPPVNRKPVQTKAKPERRARMQMNMGADTEKIFNQLIEYVQKYTLQKDASSSEIFEAMIGAIWEAKQHLSFEDVPRRGPWGSPTARAFVNGLERAFARAITNHFNDSSHSFKKAGNE